MIKIHINTLLLILLTITLVVIAIVLVRISIQIKDAKTQMHNNVLFDLFRFQQTNGGNANQHQPLVQSDFFKKSMTHAENVIKGLISADEYAKEDRQGNDIIRKFMYLNDEERKALLNSINYYQSDPIVYSEAEREFRRISQQKMIPLWIAILDDAMNKNNQKDPSSVLRVA